MLTGPLAYFNKFISHVIFVIMLDICGLYPSAKEEGKSVNATTSQPIGKGLPCDVVFGFDVERTLSFESI